MLKVNNGSTKCCSDVFITNLKYIWHVALVCFLLTLNMLMADGILYCLNVNLKELDLGVRSDLIGVESTVSTAITYFSLQRA